MANNYTDPKILGSNGNYTDLRVLLDGFDSESTALKRLIKYKQDNNVIIIAKPQSGDFSRSRGCVTFSLYYVMRNARRGEIKAEEGYPSSRLTTRRIV